MVMIADGGGSVRVPVNLPNPVNQPQQPASSAESDAAARARELQRQLEALLEKLREAQRQAEAARQRAIDAQKQAQKVKDQAAAAETQAQKTKDLADINKAKKAQQDAKLEDARAKSASAEANLKDKDLTLLKAQVDQKKEQQKSPEAKASPETDGKVQDAQGSRDEAQRTNDLSKLYLDSQEKESKAQDAEAKVVELTPPASKPQSVITDKERTDLSSAQGTATKLRNEANAANTKFTDAVGTDAQTEFYGSPPPSQTPTQPLLTVQATTPMPTDPLHSPLLQLLQVQSRPQFPTSSNGLLLAPLTPAGQNSNNTLLAPTTFPSTLAGPSSGTTVTTPVAPLSSLFQPKPTVVTPEVSKTLSSIADGKTVDQIAKDRNIGVDKVISEANAAGIRIESSKPSTDVQVTTVKKGDASVSYTNDYHSGSLSVNGSFADAKAPGGRRTVQATQDGNGLLSQTVKDEKTGANVTHTVDVKAGTRTDTVVGADGKRTETTVSLTGAPVLRPVGKYEGYLEVAEAAGLTPEQLLALNPTVDYGKPLEEGQQMVVAGVPTTVKTFGPDGTIFEETIQSDGTRRAVATDASGHRNVLMGEPDPKTGPAEDARKAIFDDKKPIAEVAKSLNLTEDKLLALLPPGTVDVTKASQSNGGIQTRTLYDPSTNRTVVESYDARRDYTSRQVIDEKTVFKVQGYDDNGKPAIVEIPGGAGYAQQQADQKLGTVGDYNQEIGKLDKILRDARHMGEILPDVQEKRRQLMDQRDAAQGEADIAQSKATSTLTKYKQTVIDENTAIAYQRVTVARPGSKEQAQAVTDLSDMLARSDKIDRLVVAADKDVDFVMAGIDKDKASDANLKANQDLQTEFEKWKRTWRWNGLDEKEIQKREAQGQRPVGPMYRDAAEENDAAWKAFKQTQEFLDESRGKDMTNGELPYRDAWLRRNQASDAEQQANLRYDNASIAKGAADAHAIQGDIDRLQAKKNDWVRANPTLFSEAFGDQKQLDTLNDQLAQKKIVGLQDGANKKYTEHLIGAAAPDREEPESLKKLKDEYDNDNATEAEKRNQQIKDLGLARTREQSKAAEAFLAQWPERNPELQKQLAAFEVTSGTTSVRAAERRVEEKKEFLATSDQGRSLLAAQDIKTRADLEFKQLILDDESRVQSDYDSVKKGQESHTWLRDIFDDSADEALDYTKKQLDGVKHLKEQLDSGEISLAEYSQKEDALMDAYGLKAVDIANEQRDHDETWSVVDEAARMGVSALAGIGATILSGGNVAVGFGVGLAVSELWDTTGDVVAAAQGRNIYADGHTSLLTLGYKARNGDATWDDVKFTLKDEAVDFASAALTPTGVGAGMRTSAALTAKFAAKEGVELGANTTLKIGHRMAIGARAGITSQAVDGAGRVGIETMHVGLDGQLGTEEGGKRISSTVVSSVLGLGTAPITGGLSGVLPLPNSLAGVAGKVKFGGAVAVQFGNDLSGSYGTGQLISLVNSGRFMNEGERTAAWIQAFPGTANNIGLHPYMARKMAAAEAAAKQQQQQQGNPQGAGGAANAVNAANAANAANAGNPGSPAAPGPHVVPVVAGNPQVRTPQSPAGGTGGVPRPVNVKTDNLPGLAGHDIDNLVVVNANSHDLSTGLATHENAFKALAPGGAVEFRIALDTQKAVASSGDPKAPGTGTKAKAGGKDNADEGGVTRKGDSDDDAAQQLTPHQEAQDNAIRVRLRGVGLDDIKITRNPNPGGKDPEIVVQASKPKLSREPDSVFARPTHTGYDQRLSYLTGDEMVAVYGSGTGRRPDPRVVEAARNEARVREEALDKARAARTDVRLGMTVRNRLNVGGVEPLLASPTMQSVSSGISTRTNFRGIARGFSDSIQLGSMAPLKDALGKELSVAVRPDEYRRTSMLQWGLSPMSRDTIFTVFAKDLIRTAKTELFGEKGTPGYGVNIRSAKDIGPAADGSGRVVEMEISVKLEGDKVELGEGEKDFFGGKASSSPDGHVKVPSSLMFDRVIEDFRIAPLLPIVKKLVGNPLPVTPSVERRSQMLLKDAVGAGDVVPTRFFDQFKKTFGDAKYRVQVVVPDRVPGALHDPVAITVRDFLAKPDVAGFKALVEQGHVSGDSEKALFFVPNGGGNHHRTSVPGKPLTEAFTDLTGKQRRVPNESTSNVWVIFADNRLERTLQRGVYGVKKVVYGALPSGLQRSAPSPHHLVGTGNLIDAMTGGRGRPNADFSKRLTAVAALPTLFDVGVLGTSVEFRAQLGVDAPSAAKSVKKGQTQDFRVSPDDTRTVEVPKWFPKLLDRSLNGATPVMPRGGTEQLNTFLDKLQTHLSTEDGAALTALREKHMAGGDKAAIGDGKFLRQPVAEDIVNLLAGLKPGAKPGSRPLLAGQPDAATPIAARPAAPRLADLNYLEGEATVNGRPVSVRDIELAVPTDSILVLATLDNPPSVARIAADLRAGGYPEGQDVTIYFCEGKTPKQANAPAPESLARELSNKIGARVHAVDGNIVLGAKTKLEGTPGVERPNLPLTDVSQKTPHPVIADADFDAQQRFWLEPGGRMPEAQAPFSQKVLDQGARVGDKAIDPLHLGIEDRVVDMRPMTAENAQEVFPLLVRQLGVSPEYNALGAEGMINKWLGEIANGTRYARVIYPATGSTPASDAPIGLISVHKEALIGDSYRNTLPPELYRGSKPAGETSREALQARGEVWQFSTYLGANKDRYPGGVINKAARMQFMKDVMRQEEAKGAPVQAFYSRVSGGAPFVTDSNGVTTLLKGHKFNVASSFSQESQTVGRGPIAVGYEDSSPFKSADFPDGEPARHIYIYETDASLYGPEGKGTLKWRSKIEEAFDKVPGSRSLLAPMRPADQNYLVGDVMVNGRPMPASDIELAVPPDSILVVAEHGNPPSAERIAADLRAAGHPEGKDVALYLFKGEPSIRADTPSPDALARELGNLRGSRVHVVDGDIGLGPRNTARGAPVVQRPNLPLTDVSRNAPHLMPADADFDAQQRFWLEPGGRTQEAQAPFSQKVLDQGTAVGDKTIDLPRPGIEDRSVELVPFDAQHARDVLPHLTKELKYSPDFMQLKADGMAKKWIDQMNEGTRMAFVIYPAPGSAAERRPLGIIAVHKEPLVGDNYIETRDPAHYAGEKPAGTASKEALLQRGEVWQFSTYLIGARTSTKSPDSSFPGGVVNSAAKKQVMDAAMAELARRGEPIDAFYARVHAGAPEAVPALGWPKTVNADSLNSQARMADGGPVAVVHEKGPPLEDGTIPTRYVAIFETPVGLYAEGGSGTATYRSLIETQMNKYPSEPWLAPKEWQGKPLVHRSPDLNYLEGNVTVNGHPVSAQLIKMAVPEEVFLVTVEEANVPSLERIVANMRAAGYAADGQEVALAFCRGGKTDDPSAPSPESVASKLSDMLGARVHAVEGTITLGRKIELGEGQVVVAKPKLPLIDVSNGRIHPNENFDAQQRYWLAPNGRGERVDAPFGAEVRNMGVRVGEGNWIDPLVLGIEERVVRLEQFSDRNAPAVLASLTRELAVSPDFNNLGPEGMARKWQQEMADGTRMAYVVYPAEGSPLGAKPLGIIALHREALIDDNYVKTLPASYYRAGKLEAGEVPREDLLARGDVWQFSTYLNADAKQVPGTNKAGKMLTIEEAAAEGKRRGEEVLAFYARVHGGGPLVLMEPHVNPNIRSLFGQESMARRGPIAVGLEQGSPVTGGADRYVLIFETDRGLYLPDGPGRKKWTADIQKLIDNDPDSASWLGAPQTTTTASGLVLPAGVDLPAARPAASPEPEASAAVTPKDDGPHYDPPNGQTTVPGTSLVWNAKTGFYEYGSPGATRTLSDEQIASRVKVVIDRGAGAEPSAILRTAPEDSSPAPVPSAWRPSDATPTLRVTAPVDETHATSADHGDVNLGVHELIVRTGLARSLSTAEPDAPVVIEAAAVSPHAEAFTGAVANVTGRQTQYQVDGQTRFDAAPSQATRPGSVREIDGQLHLVDASGATQPLTDLAPHLGPVLGIGANKVAFRLYDGVLTVPYHGTGESPARIVASELQGAALHRKMGVDVLDVSEHPIWDRTGLFSRGGTALGDISVKTPRFDAEVPYSSYRIVDDGPLNQKTMDTADRQLAAIERIRQQGPADPSVDRNTWVREPDLIVMPDGAVLFRDQGEGTEVLNRPYDWREETGALQALKAAAQDKLARTATTDSPQGIRTIDPDGVARESYDALARELGLTDSQADAMRGWTLAHRDAVTGFYDARLSNLKADTVLRTKARVVESGEDAHYVSAHLANLGGLNAAMNNVADAANVHFRGLTDILAAQLEATGGTVVPMRTAGKELGVAVVGIDEPTLANAVDATQRQVAQYAQDHGLADIPHPKHADETGVGLRIGYTSVSPDKTLNHIFTEADQGVRRSNQHVTTDTGRAAGVDRLESGAAQATPAATAAAGRRGAAAGEDGAGGATRSATQPDAPEQGLTAAVLPTRYASGTHEHARIDPEAARLQEFAEAARAAGLDARQFTGLMKYGHAPRDSVTGFYDARQSGVKANTVLRLQDHVANSDDNGFYVSADIANLSGLNQAMQSRAGGSNAHFKAMASLLADELASTGATVIPLRTGGDELAAAVVGRLDEAGLRTALDAAGQRIADYAQAEGLADIPHPKRAGEKGVGMHTGYAEALPGRTLDSIFTEADLGVDASKNAAHLRIDLEGGESVTVRTSDGAQLSASRLTVVEADGTRRSMTGAEVVARIGRDMLGRGSSADVYPFGDGQVIKIFRNSRAPDPDQSHLLLDLPEDAAVHPRMALAASEVNAVRELRDAAGESGFVDVKGPFLVGDRLALVMPEHPFAGKRLELDLETRTYSGEGSELLNERTARTAGVLTDRLNAADKFPGDPQHLVEADGSAIGFDPLEVASGELARNYHEGEALKLARTGRQNAAQRPAPDTPEAGRVQFVAGPSPERVIDAGGLEISGPEGVHRTVAGAKWAAIEPMPAPFDRDGSEAVTYVYAAEGGSMQVTADGSHTIPLEAILSGRQVDAFGRFVPDQTVRFRATSGGPGRQMPEGLIDLSKLGQKKDGPGQGKGAST